MEEQWDLPLVVGMNPAARTGTPLLAFDSQAGVYKRLGSSLNFQFSGILVSPGGSTPSSRTRAARPAEHKVTGIGSKSFLTGPLGVIDSEQYLLISTLNSQTHGS